MASLNFDDEKVAFREHYNEKRSLFEDAVASYKTLISLLLADNDKFPTPTVSGRIKNREECINKFSLKYQKKCEEQQDQYEIKDYVSDIIGVRVVCLYESDIQLIKDVIAENFEIISETDKTLALESQDDTFGYKGLHLDMKLSKQRADLPEYRRFSEHPFEVQIRTTVQDAWSILDHKIKYKKSIPQYLKRRINRMAALFELADQEFENIRNETTKLEQETANQVPAKQSDSLNKSNTAPALTPFNFMPIVSNAFQTYRFEEYKVDGFVHELTELNPSISAQELDNSLNQNKAVLKQYCDYQQETHLNRLNPYTVVRHALFISDREKYGTLLFDLQRKNFEKWETVNSTEQPKAQLKAI